MKDKTLIQFPTDYIFKIMGEASPEFEHDVLAILHTHFPKITEGALLYKYSQGNKYLSISATVYAENFEQIEQSYRALKANPRVLFVL